MQNETIMMKNTLSPKKFAMILTIVLCLILAGLAIYSAAIGARAAKVFAHNPINIFLWTMLCALIIVGLFIWKRLTCNIGLLLMHIGCVLVVAGAVWGSAEVHNWRENRSKDSKTGEANPFPKQAYMIVHDSQVGSKWTNPDSLNLFSTLYKIPSTQKPANTPQGHPKTNTQEAPVEIAELNFSLKCNKLWQTYYKIKNPWTVALAKRKNPDDKLMTRFLNPKENNAQDYFEFALLDKPYKLKELTTKIEAKIVDKYVADDFEKPTILIFSNTGKTLKLIAKVGNEVYNPDADETIVVKKFYKNFRERKPSEVTPSKPLYYDAPDGYNPVAIIDRYPGKPGSESYIKASKKSFTKNLAKLDNVLLANEKISGAIGTDKHSPAPLLIQKLPRESGIIPAGLITARFTVGNQSRLVVFVIPKDATNVNPANSKRENFSCLLETPQISLNQLFSNLNFTKDQFSFCLARYPMKIKNYFIDVSVIKDSKEVKRKVMTINDPLCYGGFYFLINEFSDPIFPPPLNQARFRATILVRSDAGISWVFIGFIAITLGLILKLWIEPAVKFLKTKRNPDALAGEKFDAPKHDAQVEHLKEIENQLKQKDSNSQSQGEQA